MNKILPPLEARSDTSLVSEAAAAPSAVARWTANLKQQTRDYEWLLLLRFALVNVFAVALLAASWAAGYIDMVIAGDDSHISQAIALIFVLGLAFCCRAALGISRDLNKVRRRDGSFRMEHPENLKERLSGKVGVIRHTANTLVMLGLIGTVVGFIVSLSGVDPGQASNAAAIGPMVATLIHGMSVALYTTLVGAVFALWLMVLHRILLTAASKLLSAARVAAHG